ncbi:twin-arginine translocation pathway signal (plasmid) [Gemmatirosa kalamazoonensis]|uniref:Twin-arginine translocation pathway signal n=1 Tax=Gemmatirosa kalamazoonensis TaxID=861299 RepID=W0RS06_9BACT|nr:gluconate 2-dehydrogenase subunit 3 family protein [Gemmatirosa kalamazoonensis]AHG93491.1 twin-arginine translocation pathway signal [Gemmatirosa kalamazoonensis]
MNRREAVKLALVGGAVAACARETAPADDDALLESIADTLLPDTPSSPGARAAGAKAGIHLLLADCYDAAAQRKVADGLRDFRARHAGFASRPQAERERILRDVDAEAKRAGDAHWFHLARELANRAYFSSEIGMTRALRFTMIPGKWVGCTDLAPGQPAWG